MTRRTLMIDLPPWKWHRLPRNIPLGNMWMTSTSNRDAPVRDYPLVPASSNCGPNDYLAV